MRRGAVHGTCGEPGAVQRARGQFAAGPHTETAGTCTAEPCTERAERLTVGPCNGQEGSVCRPEQGTGWQVPGEAVHATRREDCTARPYTARGQVHCGAVHGTGGQAHAGAVQRTIWWCVAGPHTEQVGMGMARLCMERGVSIPRLGRTQTGGKVHCGALHGTGGYAHGGATHGRGGDVRRGAVHGMCG